MVFVTNSGVYLSSLADRDFLIKSNSWGSKDNLIFGGEGLCYVHLQAVDL